VNSFYEYILSMLISTKINIDIER